jgi:hypothetical protein
MNKVKVVEATIVREERYGRFMIVEAQKELEVNGKMKKYCGYGVSRQASNDPYSPEKARFIAVGRACKAIEKKIKGKDIHDSFMG